MSSGFGPTGILLRHSFQIFGRTGTLATKLSELLIYWYHSEDDFEDLGPSSMGIST